MRVLTFVGRDIYTSVTNEQTTHVNSLLAFDITDLKRTDFYDGKLLKLFADLSGAVPDDSYLLELVTQAKAHKDAIHPRAITLDYIDYEHLRAIYAVDSTPSVVYYKYRRKEAYSNKILFKDGLDLYEINVWHFIPYDQFFHEDAVFSQDVGACCVCGDYTNYKIHGRYVCSHSCRNVLFDAENGTYPQTLNPELSKELGVEEENVNSVVLHFPNVLYKLGYKGNDENTSKLIKYFKKRSIKNVQQRVGVLARQYGVITVDEIVERSGTDLL